MHERNETHDDYTTVPLDPNDLFFVELASEGRLIFRPKSAYAASVLTRWASGIVETGALWTLPDSRSGDQAVGKLTLYFRQREQREKDLPVPGFAPVTTDAGWMAGVLAESDATVERAAAEGKAARRKRRPRRRGSTPAEIAARLGELSTASQRARYSEPTSTAISKRTGKPKRKYSRRKPKGRIVNASALKQPRRRR